MARRRRRTRVDRLLVGLFLGLLAATARAGYDRPLGVSDEQSLQLDGAPLGRVGEPAASETVRKLKAKLDLPSDDAATQTLARIRANMVKIIELAKCENATIGACLEKQYLEGRMCIDFKATDAARILNDLSAECHAEPINFPLQLLPTDDRPIEDGLMIYLFLNALHEGKHGVQDFDPGIQQGDDARQREARTKRKQDVNENEAEDLENDVIDRLKAALQSVRNGQGVPANATGAVQKLAEAYAALPLAQRNARIDFIVPILMRIRVGNVNRKTSLTVEQSNFEAFLEGAQTWQQALENIRLGRVWQVRRAGTGSENPIERLYFGDPGSGLLQQQVGDAEQSFDTLLDGTTGGLLLPAGDRLLVVGNDDPTGDGVVLGYADTDLDGFFESATRQELIRTFELHGGAQLVGDPSTGGILAYGVAGNQLVRLVDSDEDGWPDLPESLGQIAFDRADLTSIIVSDDGRFVYGEPIDPYGDVLSDPPGLEGVIAERDIDGFYAPVGVVRSRLDAQYVPVLEDPLTPGATLVQIDAPPGSGIGVYRVDGVLETLLGQGAMDATGRGVVAVAPPLGAGTTIRARILAGGLASVDKVVPEPGLAGALWSGALGLSVWARRRRACVDRGRDGGSSVRATATASTIPGSPPPDRLA